ncbi:hypothetical protein ONZ45_g10410 [Pleurotus djamor]|nr:hypothetical protein ONZ45_g10410 [Pleurotus djamor]
MSLLTNLADQRRRIDEKIAEHEAAIRRLKSQRNDLSAAHNLPSEIISVIATSYKELNVFTGPGSWLNILSICARWRRMILDLPHFWATISLDDTPFIETMLKRSRHAPLSLHHMLAHPFSVDLFTTLHNLSNRSVPQSTNIDTISITIDTDSLVHSVLLVLFIHQNLQALASIKTLRLTQDVWQRNTTETLFFPDRESHQLLSERMTSLRTLELINVLLPIDIPPLPSLLNLVVSCPPSSCGLSLFWVSHILQQTPNIENIHLSVLRKTTLSETTDDEVDMHRISLPRLKFLDVVIDDLEGFKLFELIDFPRQTRINVILLSFNTSPFPSLESSWALTATQFSHIMTGFRGKPLGKVTIYRNEFFGEFKLQLYSPNCEFPFLDLDLPSACFDLHHYTGWSSPEVLPPLSFDSVTELTIDDNTLRVDSTSSLAWPDFLRPFTSLKVLHLAHITPNELPIILQNVTTVEVVLFASIDWTFVQLETSSFLHRWHLNFVITKCTINQEQVDMLRQLISVDWDGVTREETPQEWWLLDEASLDS